MYNISYYSETCLNGTPWGATVSVSLTEVFQLQSFGSHIRF